MRNLQYWIFSLLFVHATLFPMGRFKFEEQPGSTREQSAANTADARLAALKENRAKHAQIAAEAKAGQYPEGTNFQEISNQKQKVLDQPARNYFMNSWFQNFWSKPVDDKVQVANDQSSDVLFNANKPLIKENYRLAQKLQSAHESPVTVQDGFGIFKKNDMSEAKVNNAYYKIIKDPVTGKNQVVRSGTSNQALLLKEQKGQADSFGGEYSDANNLIKPTNSQDLAKMLYQENGTLANDTIPTAESVKIDPAGLENLANTAAAAGVGYLALSMSDVNS